MSYEMTWEEKLAACQALGSCELHMRKPGDWYVLQVGAEWQKGGSGMLSGDSGDGVTPKDAVLDHWKKLTQPGGYIVLNAMSKKRRHVKWVGYMWQDL